MENYVHEIKIWIFKLNSDNTEFTIVGHVEARSGVRNLSIIFDQTVLIQQQVNTAAKSCSYYLRCIGFNSKYVSDDGRQTLVHALVTSRLYNNPL